MLNATFGNSVETLISIVALMKAKDAAAAGNVRDAQFFLVLIQTSLLGSMLSNLLLVQGSAFFVGGLRHPMQTFSRDGAVTSAGLLVLATLALSVPTMMWTQEDQATPSDQMMGLSRFVSICLLIIYLCFLLFQLRTHRWLFEKATEIHKAHVEFEVVTTAAEPGMLNIIPTPINIVGGGRGPENVNGFDEVELSNVNGTRQAKRSARTTDLATDEEEGVGKDSDDEDVTRAPPARMAIPTPEAGKHGGGVEPITSERVPSSSTGGAPPNAAHEVQIGLVFCVVYLLLSTVAVAFVSHVVVEAAEGAVESLGLNSAFIGGVVVPIVGNAAEHASALMFAWRDKMDTALAIAVGSAIQIPLFVLPVCVLTGWAADVPLTLNLDQFMMTIVVVTSLALSFTLHAGSSHWLHGLILIFEYLIIAAAFWFKQETVPHE